MTETPICLFDTGQYQKGVAWHNVGGVLRGASPDVSAAVELHYGKRAGHIPDAPQIGVLVSDPSDPDVVAQMAYQSRLMGKNIAVEPLYRSDQPRERTLAVPYINTPQAERLLTSLGLEIWGLPARMVDALKNKAHCHELITQAGIDNFILPEYYICNVADLTQIGTQLLQETENMYAAAGMSGHYPLGLMVRTAESDGNYGAAVLKEQSGKVSILPDGKTDKLQIAPDWSSALRTSSQLLAGTLNLQIENRVVVSRLMELADSPGESIVILNGQVTSLGWNGQVRDAGSSACVGTGSYQPSTDYLKSVQSDYAYQQTQAFISFLQYAAHQTGVDFSTVNGVANVDWMIPSPLENELQTRLGRQPGITVAEINPRFTNWTDAILLVMWAKGLDQTLPNMGQAIAEQILSVDKLATPIRPDVSMTRVRDELSQLDQHLQAESDSRVILRMPDKPNMGVIFTGDISSAKSQTENLIRTL